MTTLAKIRQMHAEGFVPWYVRVLAPAKIRGLLPMKMERHSWNSIRPMLTVTADDGEEWELDEGEFDVLLWRLEHIPKPERN